MIKANLYNTSGEIVKEITLPKELFDASVKPMVLAQALRIYMDHQHQGTSKVKSRGEVKMTTAKMYRQKGTGRARHGAQSAPLFVGGGVAHGPHGVRPERMKLPKKLAKLSLVAALTAQAHAKGVALIENLDKVSGKTKDVTKLFDKINGQNKTLLLTGKDHTPLRKAVKNLEYVSVMPVSAVNALHLSRTRLVLIDQEALKGLQKRIN